jgi:molybdenum cofactor cytidylyltransferase
MICAAVLAAGFSRRMGVQKLLLPFGGKTVIAHIVSGMLSSVRCGLRALPGRCRAILAVLGDQPSITTELVDLMIRSFAATDKNILVPCYEDKRGHPVLFSQQYREDILTHYDDVGLRGLLHAHPDDVFELAVSTSSVLSDMDYPDDYQRELRSMNKNNGEPAGPQHS